MIDASVAPAAASLALTHPPRDTDADDDDGHASPPKTRAPSKHGVFLAKIGSKMSSVTRDGSLRPLSQHLPPPSQPKVPKPEARLSTAFPAAVAKYDIAETPREIKPSSIPVPPPPSRHSRLFSNESMTASTIRLDELPSALAQLRELCKDKLRLPSEKWNFDVFKDLSHEVANAWKHLPVRCVEPLAMVDESDALDGEPLNLDDYDMPIPEISTTPEPPSQLSNIGARKTHPHRMANAAKNMALWRSLSSLSSSTSSSLSYSAKTYPYMRNLAPSIPNRQTYTLQIVPNSHNVSHRKLVVPEIREARYKEISRADLQQQPGNTVSQQQHQHSTNRSTTNRQFFDRGGTVSSAHQSANIINDLPRPIYSEQHTIQRSMLQYKRLGPIGDIEDVHGDGPVDSDLVENNRARLPRVSDDAFLKIMPVAEVPVLPAYWMFRDQPQDLKMGGLGPDVTNEKYLEKVAAAQKKKQYSEKVRAQVAVRRQRPFSSGAASAASTVATSPAPPSETPTTSVRKSMSRRNGGVKMSFESEKILVDTNARYAAAVKVAKMKEYASKIKKPTQFLPFVNSKVPAISLANTSKRSLMTKNLPPLHPAGVSRDLLLLAEEHRRGMEVVESIKRELRLGVSADDQKSVQQ